MLRRRRQGRGSNISMIKIKRVYEVADKSDGTRILVDRLWPRGLSRDKVRMDIWLKDIAPGDELRKWFSHEPEKWAVFKRRYFQELGGKQELVALLKEKAHGGTVTLLYGTKEEKYNNAAALKEYLDTF